MENGSDQRGADRRAASRYPCALVAAIACIIVIESVAWFHTSLAVRIGRYAPYGTDADPLVVYAAIRRLASSPRGSVPIVLLGSSQVREGLECRTFRQRTGQTCENLAIGGGSPLDMLDLVADLDRVAPHRQLVLGVFPRILHLEPKGSFGGPAVLECLAEGGAWRHLWQDRADSVFGLAEHFWPTLRFKDALAETWPVVESDLSGAWSGRLPPQPRRLLTDADAQPPSYFAARLGQEDDDAAPVGAFTASQACAVRRLIAHESQLGRPLIVVDFPTRPGFDETLTHAGAAHWDAFKRSLRGRRDVVFVPREALPPLETGDFLDFTHLSSSGRAMVSQALASIVAGYIASEE